MGACSFCGSWSDAHYDENTNGLVFYCFDCSGCGHVTMADDWCDACYAGFYERCGTSGVCAEWLATQPIVRHDDILSAWHRLGFSERETFVALADEWAGTANELLSAVTIL